MSDEKNPKAEILPPRSRVAKAIEVARQSAEAASERCVEAHRTAIATLDQSGPETLRDVIASADPATVALREPNAREAILAGMETRALLLADALQRHALLRIMDAGAAIDAISRGILSDRPKPRSE